VTLLNATSEGVTPVVPPKNQYCFQKAADEKTGNPKTREEVLGKPALHKPKTTRPQSVEIHRPYGERGGFEKVTVTLPSAVRGLLLEESLSRKKARSANWPIAAIVREAIAAYLGPKPKQ